MIEFTTVARPYAKALFDLAKEKKQTQNWQKGLAELAWLIQQPQVLSLINQTETNATDKANQLVEIIQDSDAVKSVEFKNFIQVLAQEKRLVVLPEIYRQFQNLILEQDNIKLAVIYTAYDISDDEQKQEIIEDLEQHFNTQLQASFKTVPDLIGGIKVEVGDVVLDLSVQGKLQNLYATMTN